LTAAAGATTDVVLALDIGTSGARAFAYDEDFVVRAGASRMVRTYSGPDGASWQSWPDLSTGALDCVREVAGDGGLRVAAVVLSGTASCLVTSWREAGGLCAGEVVLWSDTRAVAEQRELGAVVEASYPRTLCPAHVSYWPAKLRWLAGHGPHGLGTIRFGGAKDLLFELLSGERWTDPMTAAATGVFDSSSWEWDDELLEAASVGKDQFPDVNDATRRAPMRQDQAIALGLPGGTPVVLGGMDGPLAQLGAAGWDDTIATCTLGTSIAFRTATGARTADPARRAWCYPVSRTLWVVGGAGSNGGNVMDWVNELVGGGPLVDLLHHALALPIDPGLLFLPYLHGERSPLWRDDLRGAIVGLGAHHGRVDIVRAALDGVAAAVKELALAVSACVPGPAEVRLTGGFLAESAWVQLVTDALGVPTAVPEPREATATGAAVLGWLSLGRPAPVPPLPSRPTDLHLPDMGAHLALAGKAASLREARQRLYPAAGSQ
jgi:gluconokinase